MANQELIECAQSESGLEMVQLLLSQFQPSAQTRSLFTLLQESHMQSFQARIRKDMKTLIENHVVKEIKSLDLDRISSQLVLVVQETPDHAVQIKLIHVVRSGSCLQQKKTETAVL